MSEEENNDGGGNPEVDRQPCRFFQLRIISLCRVFFGQEKYTVPNVLLQCILKTGKCEIQAKRIEFDEQWRLGQVGG